MPPKRRINPSALIEARKRAGDGSKSAAASAAGLTWQGYHQWEQEPGRASFDWNAFVRLCDYLQVSPEAITEEVAMAEVAS